MHMQACPSTLPLQQVLQVSTIQVGASCCSAGAHLKLMLLSGALKKVVMADGANTNTIGCPNTVRQKVSPNWQQRRAENRQKTSAGQAAGTGYVAVVRHVVRCSLPWHGNPGGHHGSTFTGLLHRRYTLTTLLCGSAAKHRGIHVVAPATPCLTRCLHCVMNATPPRPNAMELPKNGSPGTTGTPRCGLRPSLPPSSRRATAMANATAATAKMISANIF